MEPPILQGSRPELLGRGYPGQRSYDYIEPDGQPDWSPYSLLSHAGKGFFSSFTTFRPEAWEEPDTVPEWIANQVGSLFGFLGWVPGPTMLARLGAGLGFRAGASLLGRWGLKEVVGRTAGRTAFKLAVEGSEVAPKVYRAISASSRWKLKSVPIGFADAVINQAKKIPLGKGLKVADALNPHNAFGDFAEAAIRLGLAGGIGGWQQGVEGMLEGMVGGLFLGGVAGGASNVATVSNLSKLGLFREMFKNVKDPVKANLILRSLASGVVSSLPTMTPGTPNELRAYAFIEGLVTGSWEQPAYRRKAMHTFESLMGRTIGQDKPGFNDMTPAQARAALEDPSLIKGFDDWNTDARSEFLLARDTEMGRKMEFLKKAIGKIPAQSVKTKSAVRIPEGIFATVVEGEVQRLYDQFAHVKVAEAELNPDRRKRIELFGPNAKGELLDEMNRFEFEAREDMQRHVFYAANVDNVRSQLEKEGIYDDTEVYSRLRFMWEDQVDQSRKAYQQVREQADRMGIRPDVQEMVLDSMAMPGTFNDVHVAEYMRSVEEFNLPDGSLLSPIQQAAIRIARLSWTDPTPPNMFNTVEVQRGLAARVGDFIRTRNKALLNSSDGPSFDGNRYPPQYQHAWVRFQRAIEGQYPELTAAEPLYREAFFRALRQSVRRVGETPIPLYTYTFTAPEGGKVDNVKRGRFEKESALDSNFQPITELRHEPFLAQALRIDIDSRPEEQRGTRTTESPIVFLKSFTKRSGDNQQRAASARALERPGDLGLKGDNLHGVIPDLITAAYRDGKIFLGGEKAKGYLVFYDTQYGTVFADGQDAETYLTNAIRTLADASETPYDSALEYLRDEYATYRKAAGEDPLTETEWRDILAHDLRIREIENGNIPIAEQVASKRAGTGDFILDPINLNKRRQLTLSGDGPADPSIYAWGTDDSSRIADLVRRGGEGDQLPVGFRSITIASLPNWLQSHLDRYGIKQGSRWYDAHVDGGVWVRADVYDAMVLDAGLHPGSNALKTSVATAAENKGLFLSKHAMYRAPEKMEEFMKQNGLHFIHLDTASKTRGKRKLYGLNYEDGVYKLYEEGSTTRLLTRPEGDLVPFDGLRINVGPSENPAKNTSAQILAKQLYSILSYDDQSEAIAAFRDEVFVGPDHMPDPEQWNAVNRYRDNPESFDPREIDPDGLSINQIIEVLGDPRRGPLYRAVVDKIMGQAHDLDFWLDPDNYINEESTSVAMTMANYTSHASRIIAQFGGSPAAYTHKLVQPYVDQVVKSYMIQRLTKPKWKYSAKAIINPWDMEFMSGLGDLNALDKNTVWLHDDMRNMPVKDAEGNDTTLGALYDSVVGAGPQKRGRLQDQVEARGDTVGWKAHLGTASPELQSWLAKKGYTHKVGRNAEATGKEVTVYLGHRDKLDAFLKELEKSGLDMPSLKGTDAETDDQLTLGDRVGIRYDIGRVDPEFHQYAGEPGTGIPNTNVNVGQRIAKADPIHTLEQRTGMLRERFGSHFEGTREQGKVDLTMLRVPVDDVSGVQQVKLGGFTGRKGTGVLMHPWMMAQMGGADTDIDSVFFYHGLPDAVQESFGRDIIKNKRTKDDGTPIDVKNRVMNVTAPLARAISEVKHMKDGLKEGDEVSMRDIVVGPDPSEMVRAGVARLLGKELGHLNPFHEVEGVSVLSQIMSRVGSRWTRDNPKPGELAARVREKVKEAEALGRTSALYEKVYQAAIDYYSEQDGIRDTLLRTGTAELRPSDSNTNAGMNSVISLALHNLRDQYRAAEGLPLAPKFGEGYSVSYAAHTLSKSVTLGTPRGKSGFADAVRNGEVRFYRDVAAGIKVDDGEPQGIKYGRSRLVRANMYGTPVILERVAEYDSSQESQFDFISRMERAFGLETWAEMSGAREQYEGSKHIQDNWFEQPYVAFYRIHVGREGQTGPVSGMFESAIRTASPHRLVGPLLAANRGQQAIGIAASAGRRYEQFIADQRRRLAGHWDQGTFNEDSYKAAILSGKLKPQYEQGRWASKRDNPRALDGYVRVLARMYNKSGKAPIDGTAEIFARYYGDKPEGKKLPHAQYLQMLTAVRKHIEATNPSLAQRNLHRDLFAHGYTQPGEKVKGLIVDWLPPEDNGQAFYALRAAIMNYSADAGNEPRMISPTEISRLLEGLMHGEEVYFLRVEGKDGKDELRRLTFANNKEGRRAKRDIVGPLRVRDSESMAAAYRLDELAARRDKRGRLRPMGETTGEIERVRLDRERFGLPMMDNVWYDQVLRLAEVGDAVRQWDSPFFGLKPFSLASVLKDVNMYLKQLSEGKLEGITGQQERARAWRTNVGREKLELLGFMFATDPKQPYLGGVRNVHVRHPSDYGGYQALHELSDAELWLHFLSVAPTVKTEVDGKPFYPGVQVKRLYEQLRAQVDRPDVEKLVGQMKLDAMKGTLSGAKWEDAVKQVYGSRPADDQLRADIRAARNTLFAARPRRGTTYEEIQSVLRTYAARRRKSQRGRIDRKLKDVNLGPKRRAIENTDVETKELFPDVAYARYTSQKQHELFLNDILDLTSLIELNRIGRAIPDADRKGALQKAVQEFKEELAFSQYISIGRDRYRQRRYIGQHRTADELQHELTRLLSRDDNIHPTGKGLSNEEYAYVQMYLISSLGSTAARSRIDGRGWVYGFDAYQKQFLGKLDEASEEVWQELNTLAPEFFPSLKTNQQLRAEVGRSAQATGKQRELPLDYLFKRHSWGERSVLMADAKDDTQAAIVTETRDLLMRQLKAITAEWLATGQTKNTIQVRQGDEMALEPITVARFASAFKRGMERLDSIRAMRSDTQAIKDLYWSTNQQTAILLNERIEPDVMARFGQTMNRVVESVMQDAQRVGTRSGHKDAARRTREMLNGDLRDVDMARDEPILARMPPENETVRAMDDWFDRVKLVTEEITRQAGPEARDPMDALERVFDHETRMMAEEFRAIVRRYPMMLADLDAYFMGVLQTVRGGIDGLPVNIKAATRRDMRDFLNYFRDDRGRTIPEQVAKGVHRAVTPFSYMFFGDTLAGHHEVYDQVIQRTVVAAMGETMDGKHVPYYAPVRQPLSTYGLINNLGQGMTDVVASMQEQFVGEYQKQLGTLADVVEGQEGSPGFERVFQYAVILRQALSPDAPDDILREAQQVHSDPEYQAFLKQKFAWGTKVKGTTASEFRTGEQVLENINRAVDNMVRELRLWMVGDGSAERFNASRYRRRYIPQEDLQGVLGIERRKKQKAAWSDISESSVVRYRTEEDDSWHLERIFRDMVREGQRTGNYQEVFKRYGIEFLLNLDKEVVLQSNKWVVTESMLRDADVEEPTEAMTTGGEEIPFFALTPVQRSAIRVAFDRHNPVLQVKLEPDNTYWPRQGFSVGETRKRLTSIKEQLDAIKEQHGEKSRRYKGSPLHRKLAWYESLLSGEDIHVTAETQDILQLNEHGQVEWRVDHEEQRFRRLSMGLIPRSALPRSKKGWVLPGYDKTPFALVKSMRDTVSAHHRKLYSYLADSIIQDFKGRRDRDGLYGPRHYFGHDPDNPEAKDTTDAWEKFFTMRVRDHLYLSSIIPKEWVSDESLALKRSPYHWLSDATAVKAILWMDGKFFGNKIAKQAKGDPGTIQRIALQKARWISQLEGEYSLLTLLAHSRGMINNLFGGSIHSYIMVGGETWRTAFSRKKLNSLFYPQVGGRGEEAPRSWAEYEKMVEEAGAMETMIAGEYGLINAPAKLKAFYRELWTRQDARQGDLEPGEIRELAKDFMGGAWEEMVQKGSWFMRFSERKLRTHAFMAHMVNARKVLSVNGFSFKADDPWLLDIARKGVTATQFLYNNVARPPFSSTPLGRIMGRFHIFIWNQMRMQKEIMDMARAHGVRGGGA